MTKISIERHKRHGAALYELNYDLVHAFEGLKYKNKRKLKAYKLLSKLRSLLEDILFEDNAGPSNDFIYIYYPRTKAGVRRP